MRSCQVCCYSKCKTPSNSGIQDPLWGKSAITSQERRRYKYDSNRCLSVCLHDPDWLGYLTQKEHLALPRSILCLGLHLRQAGLDKTYPCLFSFTDFHNKTQQKTDHYGMRSNGTNVHLMLLRMDIPPVSICMETIIWARRDIPPCRNTIETSRQDRTG